MNAREAFLLGVDGLGGCIASPERETTAILAHIFNFSHPSQVILELDRLQLTSAQTELFQTLVERRSRQEPLAYVLGFETFYGRKFKVDPSVLIPRPETEFLIEEFLNRIPAGRPVTLLDLCIGSGILGITALLERPKTQVTGLDNCFHALRTAAQNARSHGCKLNLLQGNLLHGIRPAHGFEIVLCNPPYLPRNLSGAMSADVLDYEPQSALFSGDLGLDHIEDLLCSLTSVLSQDGIAILECGQDQAPQIGELAQKAGLKTLGVRKDFRGIERIITLGL